MINPDSDTASVAPHGHRGPTWWDPLSVRPVHPTSETGPVLGAVALLVGSNVVANQILPGPAYIPWNVGVAGALIGTARRFGQCGNDELGLSRRHLRAGIRWGGLAAGATMATYLAGATVPVTRDLFMDDRASGVSLTGLLWRIGVEIPVGTVLAEEIMFRGVLQAMFRRRFSARRNWAMRADATSALLFGFWHVLPSLDLADANSAFQGLPAELGVGAAVGASVVATTSAAIMFTWLRNRSGSVVAPMLLHWTINAGGFLTAWVIQR